MAELNDIKYSEEIKIIEDLYNDQQGRAQSVERHIQMLQEKRKPKTMMEIYDALTDVEKTDIERNWGTTLDELKELAQQHDAKLLAESIPAEERRSKKQDKVLENLSLFQIMQ